MVNIEDVRKAYRFYQEYKNHIGQNRLKAANENIFYEWTKTRDKYYANEKRRVNKEGGNILMLDYNEWLLQRAFKAIFEG